MERDIIVTTLWRMMRYICLLCTNLHVEKNNHMLVRYVLKHGWVELVLAGHVLVLSRLSSSKKRPYRSFVQAPYYDLYLHFKVKVSPLAGVTPPPPTRVRTSSPSGSRTRDSGAGGGRSNKERQRLQPLASVARAPLLRSGEWGLHTALTGIHPLHSPP